jgi:uncharacterized phage protein gp47/JayE
MQWLILEVLQMTRAATSSGADLDSWMADFSLIRLPAAPASGTVTFSRFNSSIPALVPLGALVRTTDGTQIFAVTETVAESLTNQAQGGYIIGVGIPSLDVSVMAQAPGTCGNVQADAISVIASALPGVDTVLNAAPFVNGIDAETDAAFRLRFQSFMASLSRATLSAVTYAINAVQQGLSFTIQENQSSSGETQLGNFVIVLDDGSGYPSSTLLSAVQQSVETVRPIGSTFAVFPPVVVLVNVSLTITSSDTATVTSLTPQIVSAIAQYVNILPVGASLPLSMIAMLAYTASPSVTNVTGSLLNGQASDVVVQPSGVIKAGAIVVS